MNTDSHDTHIHNSYNKENILEPQAVTRSLLLSNNMFPNNKDGKEITKPEDKEGVSKDIKNGT